MRTEEEFAKCFREGFDCAMATLMDVSESIDMTEEQAKRLASCLGVGMGQGSICGAVMAAYIAIGCKYGNTVPNDTAQKGLVMSKRAEFVRDFTEEFGNVSCPALLGGLDLRKPEDMAAAREKELLSKFCPKLCKKSAEIIRTIV